MTPAAHARPQGRYGEPARRARPRTVAAVVVLAAAFVGWVIWAALGAASPEVRSQLVSFTVLADSRIRVTIEVTADRERPVDCTLQAEDRNHQPVGLGRVTLGPGDQATRTATTVVRTRARPVTAVIVGCRVNRDG
jgi:hypothetical protein